LVIARAQPRRRPGLGGDADGAFSRVDSLQSVPEAQKIGELDSVTK
jgi:hypothetical protein